MQNPKRLLEDIQKELSGQLISEEFELQGHRWLMRSLSESETSWAFSKAEGFSLDNPVAGALKLRLPTLSMGIRSIDGTTIIEMYGDEWKALDEDSKYKLMSIYGGEFEARKFFSAELFHKYLSELPPSFLNDLHSNGWSKLDDRKKEAQGELKNSSGGDLVKEENESMTKSSQDGEQLHLQLD